jgi:hypothetical protein
MRLVLVGCCLVLGLFACKSLEYPYQPNTPRTPLANTPTKIALTKILDLREPLRPGLTRQESDYFLERKKTTHGITHNKQASSPPTVVIRDLLKEELIYAGMMVVPINAFDDKRTSMKELAAQAKEQGAEYVLSGQVKAFSIVQEQEPLWFNLILTVYPFAGAVFKKAPKVTYSIELSFSLTRSNDGAVIWSDTKKEQKFDRRRNLVGMQAKMFNDLLSPLLVKTTSEALGAAYKDYERRNSKK